VSAGRRAGGEEAQAPQSPADLGYTRPRTYEELRAVLASGTVHFPKRLRQVAIFLWQHPSEVALGTISQVAALAGVQPSTLVRFAQNFGYSGFSDFQNIFKEYVKGSPRPENPARGDGFLDGVAAAAAASLERLRAELDRNTLERMADRLAGAGLIYLIGSKRAFPVAAYLALTLSQQGVRNVLVDNVGSSALDLVGCVTPGDVVLAVAFSPYNSITPDLVRVARERGAGVVSITDSALSPLVGLSDLWAEVVEADFAGVRPLAASLALGMALAHGVATRRQAGAKPVDEME
jgi:DNA-binding MurR/RpiR family transcriptional regulator